MNFKSYYPRDEPLFIPRFIAQIQDPYVKTCPSGWLAEREDLKL
jgi:hypothetical protein